MWSKNVPAKRHEPGAARGWDNRGSAQSELTGKTYQKINSIVLSLDSLFSCDFVNIVMNINCCLVISVREVFQEGLITCVLPNNFDFLTIH